MSEHALRQAAGDLAPRVAELREEIGARLRELGPRAHDEAGAAGRLRDGAEALALEAPPAFAEMLAAALALEERDGAAGQDGAAARRQTLELLYLQIMPGQRLDQELLGGGPEERLLHAPLDWARLPQLRGALRRLRSLLGVAPDGPDEEAPTVAALYRRAYYGRYLPLLYGAAPDLRRLDGRLRGATHAAIIDESLCAPLVHELSHGPRARAALPPYLDECVASYLGVRALRALAFPPLPGEALLIDEAEAQAAGGVGGDAGDAAGGGINDAARPTAPRALYAAPWLAQVGQALARVLPRGVADLAAAQAGRATFDAALPGIERAAARLALAEYAARREPHFLSSAQAPGPWLKLFFLAAAGADLDALTLPGLDALPWAAVPAGPEDERDEEILRDALCAACLRARPDPSEPVGAAGALRVEVAAPEAPLELDLDRCEVRLAASDAPAAPGAYLFPPALAARLRGRGLARLRLSLDAAPRADALGEIVARVRDGAPGRGDGYALSSHLL